VGDDIVAELTALQALIDALFASGAIDELEPLVPRFREATKALSESWRTGLHLLSNLMCFYFEARLHEVVCIYPQCWEPLVSALLLRLQ
jgi:hypothetical protein